MSNTSKCVSALMDPDDYNGEKYMAELAKGAFACFCCNRQLSEFTQQCSQCRRNIIFCKRCEKQDSKIFFGFGKCIYCHRSCNKIISEKMGVESKGFYGDSMFLELLNRPK
jgi:hypothetical protein